MEEMTKTKKKGRQKFLVNEMEKWKRYRIKKRNKKGRRKF